MYDLPSKNPETLHAFFLSLFKCSTRLLHKGTHLQTNFILFPPAIERWDGILKLHTTKQMDCFDLNYKGGDVSRK